MAGRGYVCARYKLMSGGTREMAAATRPFPQAQYLGTYLL